MAFITLPLHSGGEVTIFISSNYPIAVQRTSGDKTCYVMDGLHNNGGWLVNLSYEATIKLIDRALNGEQK